MKGIHKVLILLVLLSMTACIKKSNNMETEDKNTTAKPGGIIFFAAEKLDTTVNFYIDKIGCELWLDQGACKILKYSNMLFGFCETGKPDSQTVITFFYPEKKTVDSMYDKLRGIAKNPPSMNPRFRIYNFYAIDPEGRTIEFQYFNHELKDF